MRGETEIMKRLLLLPSLFVISCIAFSLVEFKALAATVVPNEKCDAPVWVVGDSWKWQTSENKVREHKVIRVDETHYIVESRADVNKQCYDKTNLAYVAYMNFEDKKIQVDTLSFNLPSYLYAGYEFPLFVGKEWSRRTSGRPEESAPDVNYRHEDADYRHEYDVLSYENVTVPAGNFKAYKIQYTQTNLGSSRSGKAYLWYSPEIKHLVKFELDKWSGDYWRSSKGFKLVSYRLNTQDTQEFPLAKKTEPSEKDQSTIPKRKIVEGFDSQTRIYGNSKHDLQVIVPDYWKVITGEALYGLQWAKQIQNSGGEVLLHGVMGELESHYLTFMLISTPWVDDIESLLKVSDGTAPDPPIVSKKKEIRVGEITVLERSGQLEKSKSFFKERAFRYGNVAFRFIVGSVAPVTDKSGEILESLSIGNLSFKIESKQAYELETEQTASEKLQKPQATQPPEPTQIPKASTAPSSQNFATVIATTANIRSGAGDGFSVVKMVERGDKLILLGEYGEWVNVRLESGEEGWISARWVE
jgi:hypothetical protein